MKYLETGLVVILMVAVLGCRKDKDAAKETAVMETTDTTNVMPKTCKWEGTYVAEFCPGETAGGTGICYTTTIVLNRTNDADYYTGSIRVDGWQVGWTATVEGAVDDVDGSSLQLWIGSEPEGMGALSEGDEVVRLIYQGDNQYSAFWYGPMLEYQYVDQSTDIRYTPN